MAIDRRVLHLLAAGAALLAASPTYAADIAGMTQMFDGAMRPDVAVQTFSHSDRLLPTRPIRKGDAVAPLPVSDKPFPAIRFEDHGRSYDLNDYLATNRVAGLLVLKNGSVALEDYELGTEPATRWLSFSMAKSVTSTLVGAAIRDKLIRSVDDPVVRYVPALKGSAYDGVRIRDVLTMSSGVRWDETYTDPASDRRKLLAEQLTVKPGAVLKYMATLPRAAPPGTRFNYSTGETFVLGAIVEGAVRKPLADYLSEKIWSQAGMESDASWWLESAGGAAFAGSGIGATLRDFGRFGLIAASGGRIAGTPIVPKDWFDAAGTPHRIGGTTVDYGYMWWIPPQTDPVHRGAFEAVGIFGQYIYVNPREKLVIVVLSARSKPSEGDRVELNDDAFFAAVARALR